jgi:hypothetical protein
VYRASRISNMPRRNIIIYYFSDSLRLCSEVVINSKTQRKLNYTGKGSIKSKSTNLPGSRSNHTDAKGGTYQQDHAC